MMNLACLAAFVRRSRAAVAGGRETDAEAGAEAGCAAGTAADAAGTGMGAGRGSSCRVSADE